MNFHVPHPNLSDEINANLQSMQVAGGVWVLDHSECVNAEIKAEPVLPVGATLAVTTRNTRYVIHKTDADTFTIEGHPKYCPVPVKCHIHGSTWGGSMLRMGWIGRGMHLEYSVPDGTVTTTTIEEIEVLQ